MRRAALADQLVALHQPGAGRHAAAPRRRTAAAGRPARPAGRAVRPRRPAAPGPCGRRSRRRAGRRRRGRSRGCGSGPGGRTARSGARGAAAALCRPERVAQGGVEAGDARQVVAAAAQHQVACAAERPASPASASTGTRRRTNSHQWPRAGRARFCSVRRACGSCGGAFGVVDDGDGGQQFQRRLPEIEGGRGAGPAASWRCGHGGTAGPAAAAGAGSGTHHR